MAINTCKCCTEQCCPKCQGKGQAYPLYWTFNGSGFMDGNTGFACSLFNGSFRLTMDGSSGHGACYWTSGNFGDNNAYSIRLFPYTVEFGGTLWQIFFLKGDQSQCAFNYVLDDSVFDCTGTNLFTPYTDINGFCPCGNYPANVQLIAGPACVCVHCCNVPNETSWPPSCLPQKLKVSIINKTGGCVGVLPDSFTMTWDFQRNWWRGDPGSAQGGDGSVDVTTAYLTCPGFKGSDSKKWNLSIGACQQSLPAGGNVSNCSSTAFFVGFQGYDFSACGICTGQGDVLFTE